MQKWEYCELSDHRLTFHTTTGTKETEIQRERETAHHTVTQIMAELGLDGWELVSHDASTYYFKRPHGENEHATRQLSGKSGDV